MLGFIRKNIYYFLFVILIFEWPVTAFVGWDYAAQWELNLALFCIVALAWDVVGDLVLYFLWRFFYDSKLINKFNPIKKARDYIVDWQFLEKLLKKYAFIYFLVVKVTPYFSWVWLFSAGMKKYSFWKFLFYSVFISCIAKAFYIWLWYLWWISLANLEMIHKWWSGFILLLIIWFFIFSLIKYCSQKFVAWLKERS